MQGKACHRLNRRLRKIRQHVRLCALSGFNNRRPIFLLTRFFRVRRFARQSQIDTIDRLAESAGMTRSAHIVRSAMKEIEKRNPSFANTRR